MPQTYTIVLDFDGTLHDSVHVYHHALEVGIAWLADQGLMNPRSISKEEAAGYLGLNDEEMWRRFAPQLPFEVCRRAAVQVGIAMDAGVAAGEGRLYPGVPQMLQELADGGHQLVFLSNCHRNYQEVSRRAFGLDRWFVGYFNSEEAGNAPKEQIFEQFIAPAFPGPYLVVGDRAKDLRIAAVHMLPSIGCLYGYGSPEELSCATALALTPIEIPGLVRAMTA